MKPLIKSIFLLTILEILILAAGFLVVSDFDINLTYNNISLASAVFTIITLLILIIFFRGLRRDPASQTMHTVASVSIKFLAELIFAFFWFFIAKKTGLSSVLLFFILYLTFTLFSIVIILKTLKSKFL